MERGEQVEVPVEKDRLKVRLSLKWSIRNLIYNALPFVSLLNLKMLNMLILLIMWIKLYLIMVFFLRGKKINTRQKI